MEGTFFSLLPTLIAVVFALITKEVFVSLLIGVFTGAMLICGGDPIAAIKELFFTMGSKMGADFAVEDGKVTMTGLGNAGILIFMLELSIIVALMSRSGGTASFGKAVKNRIKNKRGAIMATTALGLTMFMDDYFNRLAVGTVMKPVADKFEVSRYRLAYIIGSVSISVCILVPISSWASAISGNIAEGGAENSFGVYLSTIICNFYPVLTLLFLFLTPALNLNVINVKSNKTLTQESEQPQRGKIIDLILPMATLTALSIILMLCLPYDSSTILVLCGAITIVFCLVLYLPRKIMTLKEFTECFTVGFKSIAEVVIILILAWTLTGICDKLEVGAFIGGLTDKMGSLKTILPALLFLAAMGTAFSTGTAWGTFGMLVPLTVPMFDGGMMLSLSIAAVLSGSVFGNQVSPISDSTLLSSKVCECDHMTLIKAQLPCSLLIALVSFFGFLTAGLTQRLWAGWIVCVALFAVLLAAIKLLPHARSRKAAKSPKSITVK